jgi:hypothetical protein
MSVSRNKTDKRNKKMSKANNTNNNPDYQNNHDSTSQNRLVIVTGDKGGVGKSTFSRGLLQLYLNKNLPCIAYDADKRNPQLNRYFKTSYEGRVRFLDIFTRGGTDLLLTDLESNPFPIVLLDLPAQSGEFMENFFKEIAFFEMLADLDYRATMVSVISRVLDSVNVLEKLYKLCKNQVDYVVVKNLFHGEEKSFERYNDWSLRKKMLSEGLVEIAMPDLFYKPYDFMDRYSLAFSDVYTHPKSNIVFKGRVKSWSEDFEKRVKPAANLLALDKSPLDANEVKELEKSTIEILNDS